MERGDGGNWKNGHAVDQHLRYRHRASNGVAARGNTPFARARGRAPYVLLTLRVRLVTTPGPAAQPQAERVEYIEKTHINVPHSPPLPLPIRDYQYAYLGGSFAPDHPNDLYDADENQSSQVYVSQAVPIVSIPPDKIADGKGGAKPGLENRALRHFWGGRPVLTVPVPSRTIVDGRRNRSQAAP